MTRFELKVIVGAASILPDTDLISMAVCGVVAQFLQPRTLRKSWAEVEHLKSPKCHPPGNREEPPEVLDIATAEAQGHKAAARLGELRSSKVQ